jgi:hypothetical protein
MTSWLAALVATWATLLGPADADPACLLLGRLDAERRQALVMAAPERLEEVYASPALLQRDRDLLAGYTSRGLHLEGAAQLRLSCAVVESAPERVVFDVVDRLGPTRAVGTAGARALPEDAPTRREVVLALTEDGWRVAGSRPAG